MLSTTKQYSPHPAQRANVFSWFCISWMTGLLWRGFRARDEPPDVKDLPDAPSCDQSNNLGRRLETLWQRELDRVQSGQNKEPSLLLVLVKAYAPYFFRFGVIYLLNELLKIAQPVCLRELMQYFETPAKITISQAFLFAGLLSLAALSSAAISHWFNHCVMTLGMKTRIGTSSLIYKKICLQILQLKADGRSKTDSGQIINVMSDDAYKLEWVGWASHVLWVGPIETALILWLVYRDLGNAAFSILGLLAILVPCQAAIGKLFSLFLKKALKQTDERIKVLTEVFDGMRAVKMYSWEKPFGRLVGDIRKKELGYHLKGRRFLIFAAEAFTFNSRFITIVIVVASWFMTGELSAAKVMPAMALMQILNLSVLDMAPWCLFTWIEIMVSVKRIQNILTLSEGSQEVVTLGADEGEDPSAKPLITPGQLCTDTNEDIPSIEIGSIKSKTSAETGVILLSGATVQWRGADEPTLYDVTLRAHAGQLIGIVGPVGSGKTTLLMSLLGEVPIKSGESKVSGRISYSDQSPWIFSASIRQNVLFGRPLDKEKLQKIYHNSALAQDLEEFPAGDMTSVGDRGVTLSGGQKARVSLARALYAEADVYLLDDPLSAVDPVVGRHIFNRCVLGQLAGRTRVLVTHQTQFLKDADVIYVITQGRVSASGTFRELEAAGEELIVSSGYQDKNQQMDTVEVHKNPVDLVRLQSVASAGFEEEDVAIGTIGLSVYWKYFREGASVPLLMVLLLLNVITQICYAMSDWWLSRWTDNEALLLQRRLQNNTYRNLSLTTNFTATPSNITGSTVTRDYMTNISDSFTDMYIYIGLVVSVFVFGITRAQLFWTIFLRAARNMHVKMYNCVIRTPIRFFDTTPHGRIINRFSSDISNLDDWLPDLIFDCVQLFMIVLGSIVTVCVFNPWVILATLPLGAVIVLMRSMFVSTAQHMLRLESKARSAVYSHVLATIQGGVTIRAQGVADRVEGDYHQLTDMFSRPLVASIWANDWFQLRLDFISALFISIVTLSAIALVDRFTSGILGLTITYSMIVMWSVGAWARLSARVEIKMASVERVLEYTVLSPEAEWESDEPPPPSWPGQGALEYRDVTVSYSPSDPPALSGLSFVVKPGEKVGIVGRTGAGKSSLAQSLFRLTEPRGQILIDGLDITNIGLHELRSRICVIPQDPVLFSATMRFNLDPFNTFADDEIWDALQQVGLKGVVEVLPLRLETPVAEGGCNLSLGQRQLLCLARALLTLATVIVMDEATANVDNVTDRTIQKTIRESFGCSTVLTIAHRLHTVMDSDRIMVLDKGRLVEFDTPGNLVKLKVYSLRRRFIPFTSSPR